MDITQVPDGYKLTDLGVLPEDWEVKTLGEIAFIGSGGTPNRKISDYWGGTIPWVTTAQINSNIIENAEEFITDAGLQNSAAKMFKKGALLMAMYGQGKTRGKVAVLGINATTNQACAVIELKDSAQSNYILYNLTARYDELRQLSNSGGQENLSGSIIKKLPIALPPPNEQQATAAALGEMDALLAAQRVRLAKQRAVKQGLLQGLLCGKQRLPGFAGEWEVKRLGDFGKCLRGVSYNPAADLESHDTKDTVRLLRSNNVQMSIIDINGLQFVNERRVKPTQLLQLGDVVICMANGSKELVGKAAVFQLSDGHSYTFGAFMGCYRCSSKLASPQFVFYLFQTGIYRQYIANLLAGSSINNLNPSSIEQMEMQVPKLDEQRAIAAVLSEADAYLAALEAEHAKTQLLKQGMMQNLLTGKLRLV